MTDLIVNEFGRKPYIAPGKGQDNTYVQAMRRTTAAQGRYSPEQATMNWEHRPGNIPVGEQGEVISSLTPVRVWTAPGPVFGIAFDPAGGLYAAVFDGDIYYNYVGLGQTYRDYTGMAVNPVNGDVYVGTSGVGLDLYIRPGGVGNFSAVGFPGNWKNVAAAVNGNIYATKYGAGDIYLRPGGAGDFAGLGQTIRGYYGLACAHNLDVYAAVYNGDIYTLPGGAVPLVALNQTTRYWFAMTGAPNGNIFAAPYGAYDINVYLRPGGAGDFEVYLNTGVYVQYMACAPNGDLYLACSLDTDYFISRVSFQSGILPAKSTINQSHATPGTTTEPLRNNLKPYANQGYAEMQQFAQPLEPTGRERVPESTGLPILIEHIPEVSRFVPGGSPVVIDIPTNDKDPISGVEIYARVDGFASVAPNGTSVIYNPGASQAALLIIHTKSGQQCTVNLMAK